MKGSRNLMFPNYYEEDRPFSFQFIDFFNMV